MKPWPVPQLRRRPRHQHWQAYADGSYRVGRGAGCGVVFWTPRGRLAQRWMSYAPEARTPVEAELQALLLAVQLRGTTLPPEHRSSSCEVYSDCQSAVMLLNGQAHTRDRRMLDLLASIKQSSAGLRFVWVPRSSNRDADQCAQRAHRLTRPGARAVRYSEPTAAELDARQR